MFLCDPEPSYDPACMDRRKECRLDMEFSVMIWGVDRNRRPYSELVRATSVSATGAVLLDVHAKIGAGELVDVQHEAQRAQYRIVWSRPGEMGVQALPAQPAIFGEDVPKIFEMAGTG